MVLLVAIQRVVLLKKFVDHRSDKLLAGVNSLLPPQPFPPEEA